MCVFKISDVQNQIISAHSNEVGYPKQVFRNYEEI